MKVQVNGEELVLEKPVNIKELLVLAKADQPDYVTVQKNDAFVGRDRFEETFVEEGDTIEFLYFMGGGQEGSNAHSISGSRAAKALVRCVCFTGGGSK